MISGNILDFNKPYEIIESSPKIRGNFETVLGEKGTYIVPIIKINNNFYREPTNEDLFIIDIDGKKQEVNILYSDRIHYLRIESINSKSKLTIHFSGNFSVGKPILKKAEKKRNKKLVLHLFVDALSQSVLEKHPKRGLNKTTTYFTENGCSFTNVYAQSEWTLTSIPTVLTGKYTCEHGIYHPRIPKIIQEETIAEMYSKENYRTFGAISLPKMTPLYGFDKGFEKYVYHQFAPIDTIFSYAKDFVKAYEHDDLYLFLGISDLHETHKLQSQSCQVAFDIENVKYKPLKGNSKTPQKEIDSDRIERMLCHLEEVDEKLKEFIDYFEKQSDIELTVLLHSDHGISFASDNLELLAQERIKVPVMFKHENINKGTDSMVRELTDIKMSLKELLDSKPYDNTFFSSSSGYAITESIYPGIPYRLTVRDENFTLFAEGNSDYLLNNNYDSFTLEFRLASQDDESENLEISDVMSNLLGRVELHSERLRKFSLGTDL